MLVYAHRGGTSEHERIGAWLETVLGGDAQFGISSLVLSTKISILIRELSSCRSPSAFVVGCR